MALAAKTFLHTQRKISVAEGIEPSGESLVMLGRWLLGNVKEDDHAWGACKDGGHAPEEGHGSHKGSEVAIAQ